LAPRRPCLTPHCSIGERCGDVHFDAARSLLRTICLVLVVICIIMHPPPDCREWAPTMQETSSGLSSSSRPQRPPRASSSTSGSRLPNSATTRCANRVPVCRVLQVLRWWVIPRTGRVHHPPRFEPRTPFASLTCTRLRGRYDTSTKFSVSIRIWVSPT